MFNKRISALFFTLSTIVFMTTTTMAQPKQPMKTGDYYLEGVREVGSGFRFNPDHTFDFFFSYGAIDREAHGTWIQQEDSLILNNTPKPEKDFALVRSLKMDYDETVVKITDPNQMVIRNLFCRINTPEGIMEGETNQYGEIRFKKVPVQNISLIHEFWPDRFSDFTVADSEHNYFEFRIERWIVEVEFKDLVLKIQKNGLKGLHPIMQGKEFTYVSGE